MGAGDTLTMRPSYRPVPAVFAITINPEAIARAIVLEATGELPAKRVEPKHSGWFGPAQQEEATDEASNG